MTRRLREHGIKKELVVVLERNIQADIMSHLKNQPTNAKAISSRRASVASTSLFAFGNDVREAGFDFFERIPRSSRVMVSSSTSTIATVDSAHGIASGQQVNLTQQTPTEQNAPAEPAEPINATNATVDSAQDVASDQEVNSIQPTLVEQYDQYDDIPFGAFAHENAVNAVNDEPTEQLISLSIEAIDNESFCLVQSETIVR